MTGIISAVFSPVALTCDRQKIPPGENGIWLHPRLISHDAHLRDAGVSKK